MPGDDFGFCWGRDHQSRPQKWWIEEHGEKYFTVAMTSNASDPCIPHEALQCCFWTENSAIHQSCFHAIAAESIID